MIKSEKFKIVTSIPKRNQSLFCIFSRPGIGSQKGFTLIEVIVSLILMGILASLAGIAIVQVVQGYMMTQENSTTTQKAQLAMSRITREVIEMINIPTGQTATAEVLPIQNVNGNRIIGLDSGSVKIALDNSTLSAGDILINNVTAFTLTYYSRNATSGTVETTSTWPASNDITTLTSIDISMEVTPPGGGALAFVNRVAPRNNKNQGGAAPSATPPSAVNYGTRCFVATAAYGDPGHPMVQVLRDFRDRCLLSWNGGQWLVKQYYEHGPVAADLIRNRPIGMWTVRCLLAPVVALTFLGLYAPLAIPVLIVLSLILTVAMFSAVRHRGLPFRSSVFSAKGSILIGLIITMTIMASLGAAMLPMFSASYMNQIYADQGRKTYFLAESGFRYAASQFLNAGSEKDKEDAMTAMNNKTCNLLNSAGSFTTVVYPFWFKSNAAAAGATTLKADVHGTIPEEFNGSFSAGQIRVNNSYYMYSSGNGSGTKITFNGLNPALPATAGGIDVQPVAKTSTTSLLKGGSLTLSGNGYDVFPPLNGNFILDPTPEKIPGGAVFNYTNRIGSTLKNVTLANGNQNEDWTRTVTVATAANVVLDKFIRLSSTGAIGDASREVIYNIPVGWMAGGKEWGKAQYIDQFINDNNFFKEDGMGSHTITGGAMQVTSVVDPSSSPTGLAGRLAGLLGWRGSGSGYWAFNAFNWGNTNANLAQAWMDAEGCLSYDLQVKVKNSGPYFMAGLGFRMANNSNNSDLYQYGVSFVRARQTRTADTWQNPSGRYTQNPDMPAALIPDALYPDDPETSGVYGWGLWNFYRAQDQYSNPAIILWQRTGPKTDPGKFKLLAYRTLTQADGVLTGTALKPRLKPWSSLMVRLIEGYELPFTSGRVDAGGRHLKYGDTIKNLAGTKTARIIGTPIVTKNWGGTGSNVAAGKLMLTNVTGGGFAGNEDIYLEGGSSAYARTSAAQATQKTNYIMVYYSNDKTEAAGNTVSADNIRIGNARDGANFVAGKAWPPDDRSDLAAGLPTDTPAGNDYFTLVQWTTLDTTADVQGNKASYVPALPGTDFYQAVIKTGALRSTVLTSSGITSDFTGDAIALSTSGCQASSDKDVCRHGPNAGDTYYDDFGIQLDTKSGQGFLPPIQQ